MKVQEYTKRNIQSADIPPPSSEENFTQKTYPQNPTIRILLINLPYKQVVIPTTQTYNITSRYLPNYVIYSKQKSRGTLRCSNLPRPSHSFLHQSKFSIVAYSHTIITHAKNFRLKFFIFYSPPGSFYIPI